MTEVTDALRELAADMCDVMYDEPGIGLAAPQVGEAVPQSEVDPVDLHLALSEQRQHRARPFGGHRRYGRVPVLDRVECRVDGAAGP